jgi:hypothetical protein
MNVCDNKVCGIENIITLMRIENLHTQKYESQDKAKKIP